MNSERRTMWLAGVSLAAMPAVSFALQYMFDLQAARMMLHHLTISYVDWIFVPFNFFVVHVIDWRRGGILFAITSVAIAANIAAHAMWQHGADDVGHMITKDQVILPAGWCHLAYSTLQMILVLAFVFARRPDAPFVLVTSALAVGYFVGAAICGYLMHDGIILTDAVMVLCGTASVIAALIWPRLKKCEI
jgi:hypothetical protein